MPIRSRLRFEQPRSVRWQIHTNASLCCPSYHIQAAWIKLGHRTCREKPSLCPIIARARCALPDRRRGISRMCESRSTHCSRRRGKWPSLILRNVLESNGFIVLLYSGYTSRLHHQCHLDFRSAECRQNGTTSCMIYRRDVYIGNAKQVRNEHPTLARYIIAGLSVFAGLEHY